MSLFEFALIFSVVIAIYNIQQIKITLKQKGYAVEMFSGWLKDYQTFKSLIQSESDQKTKVKYQQILNGLHFSLGGTVLFAALIIHRRF